MSTQDESEKNPIFKTFMSRRTVVLSGEITEQLVDDVRKQLIALQALSPDRINLIIDSVGGDAYQALLLCDLISTIMTAPVRGIALGSCGSAATFVMLHCNERISTPSSRFLIHSGTRSKISVPIGQTTSENLEQLLKEVRSTEEKVLGLYTTRLTVPVWTGETTDEEKRRFVQGLIDRGDQPFNQWLSAEEAVKIGLVTGIVSGKLDIF